LSEDCKNQILVFDVGGSHIAASVFSPMGMTLGPLSTVPVPGSASPAEFFDAFESLTKSVLPAPVSPDGVAIAMPNPFDSDRGVSYMKHKYRQLYGIALRPGLAERLRCDSDRIHFLNDAAAFLMGELAKGAATGVCRSVGITLGTGVGSAFAADGRIVVKSRGVPPGGEIWDLPYRDSIVEDVISTSAIQRMYEQLTGIRAEVRDIATAGSEHPQVRQTFERFGTELGKVLRSTCLEFGPERIVIGGGISRSAGLFLPSAENELVDTGIQLRVSELFERAPLIGAGVSWTQKDTEETKPPKREPTSVA
jgi:glucokinase